MTTIPEAKPFEVDLLPSDCRSKEELIEALKRHPKTKLLAFWGPEGKPGVLGRECLSQWYPSEFTVGGLTYPTAEHYMMHQKALLFGDEETAAKVLEAKTPQAAKALGRAVKHFSEEEGTAARWGIVTEGSYQKFLQSEQLCDFLKATEGRVLIEASPHDKVWGIGISKEDERLRRPRDWPGENLLGFALMEARMWLYGF